MMRFACPTLALTGAVSLLATGAFAQTPLTLADVLSRARERAPQVLAARLAVEEARGRVVGASLRAQSNPELEVALGGRSGNDSRSTDIDAGLTQRFEPASRRNARLAGAHAAIDQSTATLEGITRAVLINAASAFYRVVHANERIRTLNGSEGLAATIYQVADRRFRAGDLAVLDVNIARASLARVRAERDAAAAAKEAALGELKQVLRFEGPLDVIGSLVPAPVPDSTDLLRSALLRPELRELEAAIRETDADVQFGRSFARPEYGLTMRYQREERTQALLGGVTVTLPLFSKGQEMVATGSAKSIRLRAELDAARQHVQAEVGTALAVYGYRLEAVRGLERDALPGLDENETLAARSFEVGQLGLPELLLIRRELLDTRFQYLDAQLEASLARMTVDAAAGVLK